MGTTPRGTSAALPHLPHDVLLHILDRMTPAQTTLFSQLCTTTAAAAADPAIWASLARRHLGIAPAQHALSAATLSSLAASLVSRWWLATGAFVPGVPVHFRKGFTEVHARGGVERDVADGSSVAAYVFGGRHRDAAVPVAVPAVTMHFFLDAAGPFPMEGMLLRLVHVSEPAPHDPPAFPSAFPPPAPPAPDARACAPDVARVRIVVNGSTLLACAVPAGDRLHVLDVHVPPELLLTKPRLNTVAVEYDRASRAAYWLKSVDVVPCILPLPPIADDALRFAPRVPDVMPLPRPWARVDDDARATPPEEEPPRERPREEHSPPPRRAVGSPPHPAQARAGDAAAAKHHKAAKVVKQARKPKHVFHHNHYRSPRGNAPGSPRARAGR